MRRTRWGWGWKSWPWGVDGEGEIGLVGMHDWVHVGMRNGSMIPKKYAAIAQLGLPIPFRGQSPHVWGSTLAVTSPGTRVRTCGGDRGDDVGRTCTVPTRNLLPSSYNSVVAKDTLVVNIAIDIDKPAKIEIDSVAASEPQAHVPMTAVA